MSLKSSVGQLKSSRNGLSFNSLAMYNPLNGWTPKKVANGTFWLRADLGVTLGTGVSAWKDQINGATFTQNTGTQQPSLLSVNTFPNGSYRAAVSANSTNSQFLSCNSWTNPGSNGGEGWIILKSLGNNSLGTNVYGAFGNAFPDPPNPYFDGTNLYPYTNADIFDDFGSNTRFEFTPTVSLTSWRCLSFKSIATPLSWTAYLSGTQQFHSTGQGGIAWRTNVYLFQQYAAMYYGNMQLAEIWIGSVMSTADRAQTRNYITSRYGITLGSDWI